MKYGKFNIMKVNRLVDFGAYLADKEADDSNTQEVLLPKRYFPEDGLQPGDEIKVFLYKDSEDRPVATTETPYAQVGEFAFLQVNAVNKAGAFLDWGLPKDLMVPYSEQAMPMRLGGIYPVYVYFDHESERIVATSKIRKYLDNVPPTYRRGQKVKALVYQHSEAGYKAIVDNLHSGLFYNGDVPHPLEIGQLTDAYVKQVRDDGKIDLSVAGASLDRMIPLVQEILRRLRGNGGTVNLGDDSKPEEIRREFGCSKKDFKRALSHLYKQRAILLEPHKIMLSPLDK